MSNRARRRADRDRMKRKAAKFYPGQCPGKFADNLKVCNGPCCGNPRRWFGDVTWKELAAREAKE